MALSSGAVVPPLEKRGSLPGKSWIQEGKEGRGGRYGVGHTCPCGFCDRSIRPLSINRMEVINAHHTHIHTYTHKAATWCGRSGTTSGTPRSWRPCR